MPRPRPDTPPKRRRRRRQEAGISGRGRSRRCPRQGRAAPRRGCSPAERAGRGRSPGGGGRETPVPSGAAKPRSPQGPPPKLVLGGLLAGRRLSPQPAGEPRGREAPLTALMAGEGLSHPRWVLGRLFFFFSIPRWGI